MFIKKIVGLVLLILGLAFMLKFVSSLDFNKTGFEGFIGAGPFEKHVGRGNQKWEELKKLPSSITRSNMCNLRAFSNPPQLPVYFVEGLNAYTNHMRLYTASKYVNGVWIEDNVSYDDRPVLRISEHMTRYKVTPLIPFRGHIPVSKDTCYVSINAGFNRSTGTFLVGRCDKPYLAVSTAYEVRARKAARVGFSKIEMNPAEYEAIRRLALRVTSGARDDYERVVLIEEFLKRNYRYDPSFERPPPNVDPVYWFLFKERRGICKQFASAFVVMCNSIGIPARLVVGYLARPTPQNQTVFASQAHAWAEVRFERGWVEFDPTPSPTRIPTVTRITDVKGVVKEGENFTVRGVVETRDGRPVESGYVEIFLKKNKSDEKGILLKLARFENGRFSVEVRAPNVVGEYYILAHYVGSLAYMPSWSDPIIKIYSPPHFEVEIPKRVSTNLTVRGRLVNYNGSGIAHATVFVLVDGKTRDEIRTDGSGRFIEFLRLSRGRHEIELYYPGSGFVLPVRYERVVVAGDVDVVISNTTVIAGRDNELIAAILFNGNTVKNESVEIVWNGRAIKAETDSKGFVRFDVKPGRTGIIPLEFRVFGYTRMVVLKAVAGVDISASYENGVLTVKVFDDLGKGLGGKVFVNGKPYKLEDGIARVRLSGSRFVIYYPGDEFHPAKRVVYEVQPLPIWLLLIVPAGLAIGLYYWRTRSGLFVYFYKEIEEMPLIWRVGEEIRFKVVSRDGYRVLVDGRPLEGNTIRFDEEGVHVLRVERVRDGRVREVKEFELKIVDDYGKAIAEIFGNVVANVERLKGLNLRDATPREVMEMLKPCEADVLLRLFELYRYGNRRGFGRSDFVEAFRDYLKLRRCCRA